MLSKKIYFVINVFQDDRSQNVMPEKKPWEKNGNATNGNKLIFHNQFQLSTPQISFNAAYLNHMMDIMALTVMNLSFLWDHQVNGLRFLSIRKDNTLIGIIPLVIHYFCSMLLPSLESRNMTAQSSHRNLVSGESANVQSQLQLIASSVILNRIDSQNQLETESIPHCYFAV